MTRTIEMHLIQTLPPSRVNRGEDGSPKSINLGGAPRVRVSSQSIKRAQRTLSPSKVEAVRTKKPHNEVLKLMPELEIDSEVLGVVMDVMALQFGEYDETGRLKTMVFLGHDEIERAAEVLSSKMQDLAPLRAGLSTQRQELEQLKGSGAKAGQLKERQAALSDAEKAYDAVIAELKPKLAPQTVSADVAIYGRFMAEDKNWNVEAASSYGHAFGVSRAQIAADFFTAIDDADGGISAHIGTTDHAAPTLYRMAVLDIDQLETNLNSGDVAEAVNNWMRGFVFATPSGGQHGAFARTLPEYVMVVARSGGHPVSYANAFVEPVYPADGQTLIATTVKRLKAFVELQDQLFGQNGKVKVMEASTLSSLGITSLPLDQIQSQAQGFLVR